jgi:hypothetical protein
MRTIYQHEKRTPTSAVVIAAHIGFAKFTGPAGRVLSALKQYGLLEETDGKFRVSDAAYKILMVADDSPERNDYIRKAALKPVLFRELLTHYKDGLPSDATLREYLIFEKQFNPASVDQFIRILKATIELAKLDDESYTGEEETEDGERGIEPMETPARPLHKPANGQVIPPPPPSDQRLAPGETEIKLNVSQASQARIIFNGQVTQEAIDLLVQMLNIQKLTFPKEAAIARLQPRRAIWRNKDVDQPVTVIDGAGSRDGRRYVMIEESATAIPEDEVEFEDA